MVAIYVISAFIVILITGLSIWAIKKGYSKDWDSDDSESDD